LGGCVVYSLRLGVRTKNRVKRRLNGRGGGTWASRAFRHNEGPLVSDQPSSDETDSMELEPRRCRAASDNQAATQHTLLCLHVCLSVCLSACLPAIGAARERAETAIPVIRVPDVRTPQGRRVQLRLPPIHRQVFASFGVSHGGLYLLLVPQILLWRAVPPLVCVRTAPRCADALWYLFCGLRLLGDLVPVGTSVGTGMYLFGTSTYLFTAC